MPVESSAVCSSTFCIGEGRTAMSSSRRPVDCARAHSRRGVLGTALPYRSSRRAVAGRYSFVLLIGLELPLPGGKVVRMKSTTAGKRTSASQSRGSSAKPTHGLTHPVVIYPFRQPEKYDDLQQLYGLVETLAKNKEVYARPITVMRARSMRTPDQV